MSWRLLLFTLLFLLAGCEGRALWETPQMKAAKEEDAQAAGAACRLAGRTLEDCFAQNPRQGKAHMLMGWKQMNDYMSEAKLAAMPPASANPPVSCDQKHPVKTNFSKGR